MTNAVSHYWVNHLDPIILNLGPLAIRWYGLMYILGFAAGYMLLVRRQRARLLDLPDAQAVQDMLFYAFCGVLVGGRLGHCLFYDPAAYLAKPWEILMVWTGGMSSHGGFIGVMVMIAWFARRRKVAFLNLLDNVVYAATPGLFFGRIGNFINGELPGKVTQVPWAVVFPSTDMLPRHPVQIYQALTEGVLLFFLLSFVGRKKRPNGLISALFALAYASVRIATETLRESSSELAGPLGITQGQFLSLFVVVLGVVLLVISTRQNRVRNEFGEKTK